MGLSFPHVGSVNDGIDGNDFPLSYFLLDDAIDVIKQKAVERCSPKLTSATPTV